MAEEKAICMMRALHAAPGAPSIDIWIDGAMAVGNLAYGQLGTYAEIPAGKHQVQIYPAGTEVPAANEGENEVKPLATGEGELAAGQSYTIAILGGPQEMQVSVLADSTAAPAPNRAKARFLQAAPGAGAMDVNITHGPTLFRDVQFGKATDYVEVPAGQHTLVFRPAGGGFLFMFSLRDQEFAAGNLYTFVALGLLYEEPRLQIVPMVDKPTH